MDGVVSRMTGGGGRARLIQAAQCTSEGINPEHISDH